MQDPARKGTRKGRLTASGMVRLAVAARFSGAICTEGVPSGSGGSAVFEFPGKKGHYMGKLDPTYDAGRKGQPNGAVSTLPLSKVPLRELAAKRPTP